MDKLVQNGHIEVISRICDKSLKLVFFGSALLRLEIKESEGGRNYFGDNACLNSGMSLPMKDSSENTYISLANPSNRVEVYFAVSFRTHGRLITGIPRTSQAPLGLIPGIKSLSFSEKKT